MTNIVGDENRRGAAKSQRKLVDVKSGQFTIILNGTENCVPKPLNGPNIWLAGSKPVMHQWFCYKTVSVSKILSTFSILSSKCTADNAEK